MRFFYQIKLIDLTMQMYEDFLIWQNVSYKRLQSNILNFIDTI